MTNKKAQVKQAVTRVEEQEPAAEAPEIVSDPLTELVGRADQTYGAYRQAQQEVTRVFREMEQQREEAYKQTEQQVNSAYEQAIEQALRVREKAEQQAWRASKESSQQAWAIFQRL